MLRILSVLLLSALLFTPRAVAADAPAGLIGHWKLHGDANDYSGNGLHARNHGVEFTGPKGSAKFNGRDSWLEVPAHDLLKRGTGDFTVAAWVETDAELDDVLGDILSQYDPATRRGFQLTLTHNVGGTTSQANYRHLQFGIDNDKLDSQWTDCGRPGQAVLIFTLGVHNGKLYAGTCEAGADQKGRVFEYQGNGQWRDLGAPDRCNAVSCLAVYDGQLYVGVSQYRLSGSALADSENTNPGGKVYRHDPENNRWIDCGKLGESYALAGLAVYKGRLYGSSLYKPAGLYRYEGGTDWTHIEPVDGKRVQALAVYNGQLFTSCYDGGLVFRFDGEKWTDCGQLGDNTQTYCFAVLEGQLYAGTWPSGRTYRYVADNDWVDVGQIGQEQEVMAAAVYNGQFYAGSLPLAEVYRFDGPDRWFRTGRLDMTPDVKYRRAWTMAVYDGKLFCGTLPSGHVMSLEAGKNVTHDRELPPGWQHVAAVRSGKQLQLFVNGRLVARSTEFDPAEFDLTTNQPLKIGFGRHDYFNGRMRDVRLYSRALTAGELTGIAGEKW